MANEYSSWIAATAKHMQKRHKMVNESYLDAVDWDSLDVRQQAIAEDICIAIEQVLKKHGYEQNDTKEMAETAWNCLFAQDNIESNLLGLIS